MKIINLTPHTVNVNGKSYQKEGIARCQEHWDAIDKDGIAQNFYYHSAELPAEQEGVFYIVSIPVALAAPHRKDLLLGVGQKRDVAGRIIGCECLADTAAYIKYLAAQLA